MIGLSLYITQVFDRRVVAMFSSTAPAASVKSSRRRPRPSSSEGSISQPKAKRQRSALSEQTFLPPDGPPEMQEVKVVKANGSATKREPAKLVHTPRQDLAVRGKKPKAAERIVKGDGSVTLVCLAVQLPRRGIS